MSEFVIERVVREHAEKRGWLVRKMRYIGRKGCPDRWFFRRRSLLIIEFKASGEEPNILQSREHVRLGKAGFRVHVIDNIKDGVRLIDAHTVAY